MTCRFKHHAEWSNDGGRDRQSRAPCVAPLTDSVMLVDWHGRLCSERAQQLNKGAQFESAYRPLWRVMNVPWISCMHLRSSRFRSCSSSSWMRHLHRPQQQESPSFCESKPALRPDALGPSLALSGHVRSLHLKTSLWMPQAVTVPLSCQVQPGPPEIRVPPWRESPSAAACV